MSKLALAVSSHVDTFTRDHLPPADQWPIFLFDRPELQYPTHLNIVQELVDTHVSQGQGARPALYGRDEHGAVTWTYHKLQQQIDAIAQALIQDLKLVAGNRVLLRGANSPMMAACLLAGIKAGLVMVPTMPMLRASELRQVIEKAQITAALCSQNLSEELSFCLAPQHPQNASSLQHVLYFDNHRPDGLEALMTKYPRPFCAHPTSKDDVCLIAFTSGTTGQPKGTMHFHRDILAMCDLFPKHILEMNASDIVCGTPPLAFTFGLGGLLAFPLRYGASTILLEKHTPETLLDTMASYRATQCYTAPTFYRQMASLAHAFDLSSLRHPVSAGEPLPESTRQRWKDSTGTDLTDGIGGTELTHIYISSAGKHARPGCIGRVVPGYIAKIVDQQMRPVPAGTPGRLAVRGPTGCRYLEDLRQTEYVREGWNLPGDTFVMDKEGYFTYIARNDDMIVSAGYNVAAPEVEGILLQHPAVAECAVIGQPDAERGQVITAFVTLNTGFEPSATLIETLQNFVKKNIAPFKYPRKIIFLKSLPRTATGKLQRFRLREMTIPT